MKNSFISTLCKENIDNPRIILYKINEENPTAQICLILNKEIDSKGREIILISFLSIPNTATPMVLLRPNQVFHSSAQKYQTAVPAPEVLQGLTGSSMAPHLSDPISRTLALCPRPRALPCDTSAERLHGPPLASRDCTLPHKPPPRSRHPLAGTGCVSHPVAWMPQGNRGPRRQLCSLASLPGI